MGNSFAEMDARLETYNAELPQGGQVTSFHPAHPTPDMSIVQPDKAPAPEMTPDEFTLVFGEWASWLQSSALVKGAPIDYVALALVSAASGIIGNTRWAVPWSGWKEPPVIWGMVVGDPSAGKSPALDAVLDPIKEIEAELTQEYLRERDEWSGGDEIAKLVLAHWKVETKTALSDGNEPPEKPEGANAGAAPVRRRIRITDATTEKVAELLATTWRGLLMSRDELSGWLGSMDRYSNGGDRPFWLESFGGRSFTVDRKNSPEPIAVDHLTISVLGGTQPDKLESLLVNSDDDGLLARFLTVYPNHVPLSRPDVQLDGETPLKAFKKLYSLEGHTDDNGTKRPLFVNLDEGAKVALQAFRVECREWEQDVTGLYRSHIGKLPGLVVRVSLILALLDWSLDADAPPVSSITGAHIARACHYVGQHLRHHAKRAYGSAATAPEVQGAAKIAKVILEEGLTEISTRIIQRRCMAGLGSAREIAPAVRVLCEGDWLRQIETPGPGRNAKKFAVNPLVRGAGGR